jgi:hypothetical protein
MKLTRITALLFVSALATTAPAADAPKALFTLSKETTVITAPLRPDGAPDYVVVLNEKYGKGVTPDNNAFVSWLDIAGSGTSILPTNTREKSLILLGIPAKLKDAQPPANIYLYLRRQEVPEEEALQLDNQFSALRRKVWLATDAPRIAAYLQAHIDVLDRVVLLAEKPRWWIPLASRDGSLVGAATRTLGEVRDAADMLAVRALMRAGAGDSEGFQKDIFAVRKLARLIAQSSSLLDQLTSMALENVASEGVGAAVASGRFSDAQCRALAARWAEIAPFPAFAHTVDQQERWTFLELVASFPKPGVADALLRGVSLDILEGTPLPGTDSFAPQLREVRPEQVDWDIVLRMTNDLLDLNVHAMNAPSLKTMRAED